MFYVVYGEFGELPILDSSKYRSAGVPFGFELSRADSERYPDDLTRFQEGYVWDTFRNENADLAAQVAQSRECLRCAARSTSVRL